MRDLCLLKVKVSAGHAASCIGLRRLMLCRTSIKMSCLPQTCGPDAVAVFVTAVRELQQETDHIAIRQATAAEAFGGFLRSACNKLTALPAEVVTGGASAFPAHSKYADLAGITALLQSALPASPELAALFSSVLGLFYDIYMASCKW